MLVVDVGGNPDNSVRRRKSRFVARSAGKKLEHGIGPIDMPIDRILPRKHALGESRANDRDRLSILVIERVEIAAGNNGNAKRGEKAGRDGSPQRPRIVFAMDVTITRELK